MKVLSLSDKKESFIYSPQVRERFADVDIILGCGDLEYYYLEYVYNALNVPLLYVRGNHDKVVEYGEAGQRTSPWGGVDLHRRSICRDDVLFAGVEGSLRYRPGMFQYNQSDMWRHVYALVPQLLLNRIRYGRYLDVFVTHAPPLGVHDKSDLPHQGIKAFSWLLRTFHPAYHFHGHVHIYRPGEARETRVGRTLVINAYRFRETDLQLNSR
jgi:Icc-related predicted phosphoesterase